MNTYKYSLKVSSRILHFGQTQVAHSVLQVKQISLSLETISDKQIISNLGLFLESVKTCDKP